MQRKSVLTIALLVAGAVATGLWFNASRGADAPHAARTGRNGDGAAVAVMTAVAERADMPVRKRAIGFVETSASVVVKSRLDSQLMAQHVVDGQFVKAGDLLFTLDDRDLKAQIDGRAGAVQVTPGNLANQGLLIMGAILTIYIVLGILYESFIHPLTILTGLPSAAIGALGALRLFNLDLSVIAIIGLLMLIGIVKKNAIMMIDVALVLKREGKSPQAAIHQACVMRFRPILMTTLAALMGTLPIALGAGASAELRQPLGIAVVGGLMISQVPTLFITPVLFLYMERLFTRRPAAGGGVAQVHPAPAE